MRYKIPTIIGIVLIFGYFIRESFRNPTSLDPTQIVIVGKDTLGRDWGAIADQRERERAEAMQDADQNMTEEDLYPQRSLLEGDDPYARDKFDQSGYTSIQAADGREIITGYDRPSENAEDAYETRHQKELKRRPSQPEPGEPQIIYKE
jgi:hypothetical protein